MSGRIKFLDADLKPLVAENTPPLGYEYDTPGEFDRMCGTVGLDAWQLPNDHCPDQFVCGLETASIDDSHEQFGLCLEAMNCKMMAGMTTNVGPDPISLFNYHMIPHHINAIDMAKALLPFAPCDDLTNEDDPLCVMQVIVREIINTQNFQIQAMRKVLETLGSPPEDDCAVTANYLISSSAEPLVGENKKDTKEEKEEKDKDVEPSKKSKKEKKDMDDEEEEKKDSDEKEKEEKKEEEEKEVKEEEEKEEKEEKEKEEEKSSKKKKKKKSKDSSKSSMKCTKSSC
jgi:Domain of unknown function (DUF305)